MEFLIWTICVILVALGVVGVVIPFLPGTGLIFLAAIIHKLLLPAYLSWWTVGVVGVGFLFSCVMEWLGVLAGAKFGGATRWGLIGAIAGGCMGLFLGPPGLIVGPIVGAIVAEIIFSGKEWVVASRAGMGAGIGWALSFLGRLIIACVLAALIIADWLVNF